MASTLMHLRFDEANANVAPADDLGRLTDLVVEGALTLPAVTGAFTGWGRLMTSTTGLVASDVVPGSTLTTRDLTIQALVWWDFSQVVAPAATIIQRGKLDTAPEYIAYALDVRMIDVANRVGEIRLWWQDTAGALHYQPGGQFYVPTGTTYLLLTAVRHWISTTQVELRYYVGDQLVGDILSSDGNIGGATTGNMVVGCRHTGSSGDSQFFRGVIDEIRVLDYELTAEEIAATWGRLSQLQPRAYQAVRQLLPPGAPISNDPASRIQKLLRVMGHGLGYAAAQIANVRDNQLPDRAYGAVLAQWEALTGSTPIPTDTAPTRRRRVVGRLRQRAGSSVAGVAATVTSLLQLNASQLQILAFSNTVTDAFQVATIDPQRWQIGLGATVSSNQMLISVPAATDARFGDGYVGWYQSALPVQADGKGAAAIVKITPAVWPVSSGIGIAFWDAAKLNGLLLELQTTAAGVQQIVYQQIINQVSQAQVVLTATSNTIHWLTIQHPQPSSFEFSRPGASSFTVGWSTTSATAGWTYQTITCGFSKFQLCSLYARSLVASTTAISGYFDDVSLRCGLGDRPNRWYVFRDPALPGKPDLAGAQRILQALAQAHTRVGVVTSKSCFPDTPATSLCDSTPLGAI
jgi:hypothetical protein